jgi:hypothetical protein
VRRYPSDRQWGDSRRAISRIGRENFRARRTATSHDVGVARMARVLPPYRPGEDAMCTSRVVACMISLCHASLHRSNTRSCASTRARTGRRGDSGACRRMRAAVSVRIEPMVSVVSREFHHVIDAMSGRLVSSERYSTAPDIQLRFDPAGLGRFELARPFSPTNEGPWTLSAFVDGRIGMSVWSRTLGASIRGVDFDISARAFIQSSQAAHTVGNCIDMIW